jgi:HEAT repeat protein
VTPVRKWKLISLVLAGCLSYSWWSGDAPGTASAGAKHARLKGPVRVSAAALGITTEELVRQLLAAKDPEEVRALAEKLGMIGDDDAIDAVMPLLKDPRSGVPEAILGALGAIATDHAVDVLIKAAADPNEDVSVAAITALGATQNKRAEPFLIATAQRNSGAQQSTAVYALGELGGERAVEVIAQIAAHPTDIGTTAMRVLGTIELPSAKAAIVALVDSPNMIVAGTAIREIAEPDDEMVAKLVAIVDSGEAELVGIALGALARAGDKGLPALQHAALHGGHDLRVTAMNAMSEIDNPKVLETLRTILDGEEGRIAEAAARAIAGIDSDEARDVLISAALSDRATETGAVDALMEQTGPEVEQALLVIAKSDSKERWDAIQHLMTGGNAEALALAVSEARGGRDETARVAAMEALAEAGSQPAIDSLIDVVRNAGDLKPRALAILAEARPDDPVVAKLLGDAVQSRDPDEAAAAASALSKVGTDDARDALVAALGSTDAQVAGNAASSLAKFRLTDDMTAALKSSIIAHPELKTQVMQQLVAGGSPFGIELAKQAIGGEDPREAYHAISALESSGSPAAFDVLSIGARAKDAQVRRDAINSLGNLGDKRALDVVAQAIKDPEPTVRYAAVRAIGATGTQQARELLVNLTRSQDVEDRRAAVTNLRRFEDANTTRRLTELLRDSDPNVAYSAMDASIDRPEALPALKALIADSNAAYYVRREAAQNLSYRGVSDPAIDAVLESDE